MPINQLIIPRYISNELNRKYHRLPSEKIEFGGYFCGRHLSNNNAEVLHHIDVPSLTPSESTYTFDRTNVKVFNPCSPNNVVAIWHTHPKNYPIPSEQDRNVSSRIKIAGCVLTEETNGNNGLTCFNGKNDIQIKSKTF